ncbi:hypothetical protein DFP94_1011135 [Fontibacillus phaseoli]|uniref:Uncharacterized protein n=1 Tax=Fontibacillus phaseoli TaxID=1416533 RepID=A0A369BSG7_9BACL|nr:hypothetical protein [Fontibacillus phaseoli]RCX23536.1 hypothetical protein DFP94_1011135 [Fontibacillus phaseoli]
MLDNLKNLMWLCTAVSFCLGAVWFTLDSNRLYETAVNNMIPFVQNQKVSLSSVGGISGNEVGINKAANTYSGLQILHGFRGWTSEGAEVSVNGTLIPPEDENAEKPGEPYDQDLRFALTLLDLQGDYEAVTLLDGQGRISKLSFFLR